MLHRLNKMSSTDTTVQVCDATEVNACSTAGLKKINNAIKLRNYSVLKLLTGFAIAARKDFCNKLEFRKILPCSVAIQKKMQHLRCIL
jgi:hypothetical protein